MMRRHAELLVQLMGEHRGIREMRKHTSWYTKGFSVGQPIRAALGQVGSLAELDHLLAELDATQPYPAAEIGRPRGRTNRQDRVHLPAGWLDDRDSIGTEAGELDADAELALSGG